MNECKNQPNKDKNVHQSSDEFADLQHSIGDSIPDANSQTPIGDMLLVADVEQPLAAGDLQNLEVSATTEPVQQPPQERLRVEIYGTDTDIGELFDFNFSIDDSDFISRLDLNVSAIKLDDILGQKSHSSSIEGDGSSKPRIETNKTISFFSDGDYGHRRKHVDEFCTELNYIGPTDFTKSQLLQGVMDRLPKEATLGVIKKLSLESLLEPGSKKGEFKIPQTLKNILNTGINEGTLDYVGQTISKLPDDERKQVLGEVVSTGVKRLSKDDFVEIVHQTSELIGGLGDLSQFVGIPYSEMQSRATNQNPTVDSFGKELASEIHASFEQKIMGGLTYSVVKYFEKDDVEQKNPKEKIVVSDFSQKLVETLPVMKKISEGDPVPLAHKYYCIDGIDEILLKDVTKGFDLVRIKVNQSNKYQFQEDNKLKEELEEFYRKRDSNIFSRFQYKHSKKLKKREAELLKGKEFLESKRVLLKRTPDGKMVESENGDFYLGREAFEFYQTVAKDAGSTKVDRLVDIEKNPAFAAVFGKHGDALKESMKYHTSRFERILAYHLSEKGLVKDIDTQELREPKDLEFYRPYGNDFLDYVVRKNGKKALLICENVGNAVITNDDEIPATIFTPHLEEPKPEKKKVDIRRATFFPLLVFAAAAGLTAFSFYNISIANKKLADSNAKVAVYNENVAKQKSAEVVQQQGTIGDLENAVNVLSNNYSDANDSLIKAEKEKNYLSGELVKKDSTNQVLSKYGILPNSDNATVQARLSGLLHNYNDENKQMVSEISNLSGVSPTSKDLLDAYKVSGNVNIIKDFSSSLDNEQVYNVYFELASKRKFSQARTLNQVAGSIMLNDDELEKLVNNFGEDEEFCKNILVNQDYSLERLEGMDFSADYAKKVFEKCEQFAGFKLKE